jgi:hypothetical protein
VVTTEDGNEVDLTAQSVGTCRQQHIPSCRVLSNVTTRNTKVKKVSRKGNVSYGLLSRNERCYKSPCQLAVCMTSSPAVKRKQMPSRKTSDEPDHEDHADACRFVLL